MAEDIKKSQGFLKNVFGFFREIKNELKKVIWPTKSQLINNTLTVLLLCLIIGAMIWLMDFGLQYLRSKIYNV